MTLSATDKNKQHIVLYFQVHQPRRLNPINFFDLAHEPLYFNDALNKSIIERVARECYLPANKLLLKLIEQYPKLRITFSLSGVIIEQLEAYAPEVLESFHRLAQTGAVEFLGETYYHSLASLIKSEEFEAQVLQHAEKMIELFGVRPTIFRNTELIYNDDIGKRVAMMGFQGIFTEGHENTLDSGSPHQLYTHPEAEQLKIFLRNYRLSDDIGVRFMQGENCLTIKQYMSWLNALPLKEKLINLSMDYETFGEHHKSTSGIFQFLTDLLTALSSNDRFIMVSPSEALQLHKAEMSLSVPGYISWADQERDVSAWLGNDMQKDAFNSIMKLEREIKAGGDAELIHYWRCLQTSDHFYFMSLKTDSDGSIHSYFSPFPSSYDAFINYMNVLTHLTSQINERKTKLPQPENDLSSREAERQDTKSTTPVWVMNLESVPPANLP